MLYNIVSKLFCNFAFEFFMVLDFKVNAKIGCRDDNQFFCIFHR